MKVATILSFFPVGDSDAPTLSSVSVSFFDSSQIELFTPKFSQRSRGPSSKAPHLRLALRGLKPGRHLQVLHFVHGFRQGE